MWIFDKGGKASEYITNNKEILSNFKEQRTIMKGANGLINVSFTEKKIYILIFMN